MAELQKWEGARGGSFASQGFLLVGGCCLARCRPDFSNLKWPPVVSYTVQVAVVSFDLISAHLLFDYDENDDEGSSTRHGVAEYRMILL